MLRQYFNCNERLEILYRGILRQEKFTIENIHMNWIKAQSRNFNHYEVSYSLRNTQKNTLPEWKNIYLVHRHFEWKFLSVFLK